MNSSSTSSPSSLNRRSWLKASLGATAGLVYGTSLVNQLMAAPVSETERKFFSDSFRSPFKIRLNSNENPYGPSENARKAIQQIISEGNRYPFEVMDDLKALLAQKEGVSPDHIALGAGSADLLCATGAAFGIEDGRILSAYPTFPLLMNYAEVFNVMWDKVNVNEKLEHDYQALASQVKDDTRLVFVCNPNNPTGTLVDPQIVKSFCEEVSKKVPVFSDEAYLEFLDPSQQVSMVELVKKDQNVIVSRTFSKIYGLAGLRLGYIVAKPELIKKISRYQAGFPISQMGIATAKASLNDMAFVELSRSKNAEARKHLTDYLDKKGLMYGKPYTNFVFFDPKADAQQIMNKLAEKGIGIRVWDFNNRQWCRVSIGTLDEMKLFVRTFSDLV
ncbi:MAG: pyridoxal phosphate-dependent aminotransferase [Bacteroidota bacterium]